MEVVGRSQTQEKTASQVFWKKRGLGDKTRLEGKTYQRKKTDTDGKRRRQGQAGGEWEGSLSLTYLINNQNKGSEKKNKVGWEATPERKTEEEGTHGTERGGVGEDAGVLHPIRG